MTQRPAVPLIAIVGRPNVGKSTLFNRIIGARQAVVSPVRGTSRDRLYGEATWRGFSFRLIDTGGLELAAPAGDSLWPAIQRQVQKAIQEAQAILFVCDGQEGLVPSDIMIVENLRRLGKPIWGLINKQDHNLTVPPEFFSLGLSSIFPVSALHAGGIEELLDDLIQHPSANPVLLKPASSIEGTAGCRMVLIGRRNVGKSSLLNSLLDEERAIISDLPGTTRDAIETQLCVRKKPITLTDTAGLRHRSKIKHPVDLFSMAHSLTALKQCDIALVVLDAPAGVTRDDRRVVGQVRLAGCGFILLLNKWDLCMHRPKERDLRSTPRTARGNDRPRHCATAESRGRHGSTEDDGWAGYRSHRGGLVGAIGSSRGASRSDLPSSLAKQMHRLIPEAQRAPVLAVSAKTKFQLERILPLALQMKEVIQQGLSSKELLFILRPKWNSYPPPLVGRRPPQLTDVRWHSGHPCRVELVTHPKARLPIPYQRYLMKHLHQHPQLGGIPIQLIQAQSDLRHDV